MSIELTYCIKKRTKNGNQPMSIHKEGQKMGINPCPYTMKDNKWESTHVHTQRRTTNGNQLMSTRLILLGVCSHKTVGKRWDEVCKTYCCWTHMITKRCSHNMVDNKWESTHVYWAHLIKRSCENGIQRVRSHPISTRLMLPQQQIWYQ